MNKEIYNDNKLLNNRYTKGFYIILTLCVCAVGVAGWYTYSDVANFKNHGNQEQSPEIAITSSEPVNKQAEVKVQGEPKDKSQEFPTEEITVQIENQSQDSEQKHSPTGENTEVLQGFSKDKLVYFETLKDWRLHKGTDYAIEKGENVYSVSDGVVKDIVEDELYGDGIKIEYRNGFITMYYGVEKSEEMAVGKKVTEGEVIGTVTDVPCESNMNSHIHIEVTKDNQIVNPQTYIQLQK